MQRRQGGVSVKPREMAGANGSPAAPPGAAFGWVHLTHEHGMQQSPIP